MKNHPFVDGNKRIGVLSMMVFLEINGIALSCMDSEVVEIGLSLAAGKMTAKDLSIWILDRS